MSIDTLSPREQLVHRLEHHLQQVYPEQQVAKLVNDVMTIMRFDAYIAHPKPHHNPWTQQDAIVITYGDSILSAPEPPLRVLRDFLRQEMRGFVSSVHILPFFPWSSDDGFSVIDYLAVNDSYGTWDDISAIAGDFQLMSDLVINHCSARSRWFDNFKKGIDPGKDYFITAAPSTDLSGVVRPRTSALLRETQTLDGKRYVWCTFSHDQVDLNFANPDVLLEFVRIIRFYLDRGVKIFRLDAVAFLWKEIGTRCINLAQTHELVRFIRTIVEHCDTEAMIITETNIPNRENLAYFGNANEAHVIYNFSLPPLLLHALCSGNCSYLRNWLMSMPPAQNGTAYLNFIASHDGIGLRPAEGLLSDEEIDQVADLMAQFGGKVSMRTVSEGKLRPYELNIAFYDACKGTLKNAEDDYQYDRFICAHTIMMALEGIPAFYIHSLFGTTNDYQKVEHSGHNRAINRHQWQLEALTLRLEDLTGHHARVFSEMKHRLNIRRYQPAFHPNAMQFVLQLGDEIFAFWRQSIDREQSIFCLHNVSDQSLTVKLADINLNASEEWFDLLSNTQYTDLQTSVELSPYQSLWLTNILYAASISAL